jgi:hypothetical protein
MISIKLPGLHKQPLSLKLSANQSGNSWFCLLRTLVILGRTWLPNQAFQAALYPLGKDGITSGEKPLGTQTPFIFPSIGLPELLAAFWTRIATGTWRNHAIIGLAYIVLRYFSESKIFHHPENEKR